jgi:hypothetical protein
METETPHLAIAGQTLCFRASLGTLISHGIFIFPRENELIFLGKMKIPWEISVPKLALSGCFTDPCWTRSKRLETLNIAHRMLYRVLLETALQCRHSTIAQNSLKVETNAMASLVLFRNTGHKIPLYHHQDSRSNTTRTITAKKSEEAFTPCAAQAGHGLCPAAGSLSEHGCASSLHLNHILTRLCFSAQRNNN